MIDATLLVFESGVPKLSTITRTGHAPLAGRRAAAAHGHPAARRCRSRQPAAGSTRRDATAVRLAGPDARRHVHVHALSAARLLSADGSAVRGRPASGAGGPGAARTRAADVDQRSIRSTTRRRCSRRSATDRAPIPRIWTLLTGAPPRSSRRSRRRFGVSVIHDQDDPAGARRTISEPRSSIAADAWSRSTTDSEWTPEHAAHRPARCPRPVAARRSRRSRRPSAPHPTADARRSRCSDF